jgi:hypothetical protein
MVESSTSTWLIRQRSTGREHELLDDAAGSSSKEYRNEISVLMAMKSDKGRDRH